MHVPHARAQPRSMCTSVNEHQVCRLGVSRYERRMGRAQPVYCIITIFCTVYICAHSRILALLAKLAKHWSLTCPTFILFLISGYILLVVMKNERFRVAMTKMVKTRADDSWRAWSAPKFTVPLWKYDTAHERGKGYKANTIIDYAFTVCQRPRVACIMRINRPFICRTEMY